jgi:DNA polymerase I
MYAMSEEKLKKQKTFVLLDTHALIHRAFHALPPLTSPQGEPVGAVYGVANIVLKILKEFEPNYIAAAFDRPEPTFRHKEYAEYKAQRAEAPRDLVVQFEAVRELFDAFGISSYDCAGYEADDVIGTLVKQIRDVDTAVKIIIASGDLDILQLVENERTVVFTMRKGMSDTTVYDEKAVRERFGFMPEYLPDFKGLKGDPSDNIKGVPGIGEKTATSLIKKFSSLEALYSALSRKGYDTTLFKGKLPDILLAHKDVAYASRGLAQIRADVPVSFSMNKAAWNGLQNSSAAQAFFERVGFTSLARRLPAAEKRRSAETAGTAVLFAEERLLSADVFTNIIQTGTAVWGAQKDGSLAVFDGAGIYSVRAADIARNKKQFENVFASACRHVAFGGKDVLKRFFAHGVHSARIDFDIGVAAWLLEPTLREPVLQNLLADYCAAPAETDSEALAGAEKLAAVLQEGLTKNKIAAVYADIELPLIPILARMELSGILLDSAVLSKFSKKLERSIYAHEANIYKLAGASFNINSPKQLGDILFNKLGIAADTVRKTAGGGAHSTRASELAKLRGAHPIIGELMLYREEMKLKTTYADSLPQLVDASSGRIHAEFIQTGTVTGRLSSQNPNMQNIPVRTALGQEIRRAFVASPGYVLVSCDYSQIELRLAAHLSGDASMQAAFRAGADIHTATAAAVNRVAEADVTPAMRRAAKTINFGILYGMGAVSLAESLGITRKEADSFIRAYFAAYPGVKEYIEHLKQNAYENGYVETLFGRRRYFHNMANYGWQARREAERMAVNAPIQGSEADIIKKAMIAIAGEFETEIQRGDMRLLLQVHDELLFEIKKEAQELLAPRIRECMERVCALAPPLSADIKIGENWQDMHIP